jgi:hypothetical protein
MYFCFYIFLKMKRFFLTFGLLVLSIAKTLSIPDYYLITSGTTTEPYAMYGHSALRICDTTNNMDFIVDWGVFNFNQPDFYLNFAIGRMIYTTGTQSFEHFLYFNSYMGKSAVMRKIALNDVQKERLWNLVSWMLEPEQRDYRYRFLYDNCATRPRDLLETTLQNELIFPQKTNLTLTYRDILHQYQQINLWYNLLIDIILGANIDKVADFREQMFIPEYLEKNMSEALVIDGDYTHPLLEQQTLLLEQETLSKTPKILAPEVVLLFIFFVILILDYLKKGKTVLRIFDCVFFGILILFSLLILFLWIISEHLEAHNNFNIIWMTPLYVFTLIALIKQHKPIWLLVTVGYIVLFLLLTIIHVFPQSFPISMYIILAIVLERCIVSLLKTKKKTEFHKTVVHHL